MTDVSGSLVKSQILKDKTNPIDISNLPGGTYFIVIQSDRYFQPGKIVIAR
jgi:hypothetical protein